MDPLKHKYPIIMKENMYKIQVKIKFIAHDINTWKNSVPMNPNKYSSH